MSRRLHGAVDRDRILETATLDSEISMSIAATDETHDPVRYRQGPHLRGIPHASAATRIAGGEGAGGSDYYGVDMDKALSQRLCGMNVEPVIFLFSVVFGLITTIQPLFLYWARCIEIFSDHTNFTHSEIPNVTVLCAELSNPNNSYYQDIVERDISTAKIYLTAASGIPTLITAPIIGAWSDGRGGRRRPLLLGLFGFLVYTALQLCTTLTYQWLNVYLIRYAAEIAVGCTGGFATLFTASFAIVTDESRHQMLPGSTSVPLRIGIASALQSFGLVVGNSIASVFTISPLISSEAHEDGYIRAATISFTVVIMAIFYTLLYVRETHQNRLILLQDEVLAIRRAASSSSYMAEMSSGGGGRNCVKCTKSFFYDIFEVIANQRHGWARFCLNLSICFMFVEFLALDNELLFLLTKRSPYEWSDTTFTYFTILKNIAFGLGMIFTTAVMSKAPCLGQDSMLIMIGVASCSLQFLIFSVASNSSILFFAGVFSFPAGAITPGYRSFLPRMVAKEETARLFTAISIVTVFCPIVSALVFNNIFNATLDFWPGFAFLIDAGFQAFVFLGQILIHWLMLPQWTNEREESLQRGNVIEEEGEDTSSSRLSLERPDLTRIRTRTASNTAVLSDNNSPDDGEDVLTPLLI